MTPDQARQIIDAELAEVRRLGNSPVDAAAATRIVGDLSELARLSDTGEFTVHGFGVAGREYRLSQRMHRAMTKLREPADGQPVLLVCAEPTSDSVTWYGLRQAAQWANLRLRLEGDSDTDRRFSGLGVAALGWSRLPDTQMFVGADGHTWVDERGVDMVAQLLSDAIKQFGDHRLVLCTPGIGPGAPDSLTVLHSALSSLSREKVANLPVALTGRRGDGATLGPGLPADIVQLDLATFLAAEEPVALLDGAMKQAQLLRAATTRREGGLGLAGRPFMPPPPSRPAWTARPAAAGLWGTVPFVPVIPPGAKRQGPNV